MSRREIDPALGLDLVPGRTLTGRNGGVNILIPAHNEAETVVEVVQDGIRALHLLNVEGEVIVAASGCTDETASLAADAGAKVVAAPAGKGHAITAGLKAGDGDIVCLIDGDFRYYGERPLAVELVRPILLGIADVTIADLYWRPLYPQLWLHGFFAPLAGRLFPELMPKVGNTPWSGQRAAPRELWPDELPGDFTVDLSLLLHWNDAGIQLRPIVADDWVNPQRPKPDLLHKEFTVLVDHAIKRGRITTDRRDDLERWFDEAHQFMAEYRPDHDDPQQFEANLLERSLLELDRLIHEPH